MENINWNDFKKNLPEDISKDPRRTYKDDGWIDWADWLGQ